jgi:predicted RecB family nuclease
LNRHCVECEFQTRRRQKVVDTDDLSLLAGITEKERKEFNSKGILTVTLWSFTFRPRRRPEGLKDKRERHRYALRALALRENKRHIVGTPEFKIEGTPVYLDVEGLPGQGFYWPIGCARNMAGRRRIRARRTHSNPLSTFPTHSNGLKEIAGWLGFRWSAPRAANRATDVGIGLSRCDWPQHDQQ